MNPEMQKELLARLDTLALKMGVATSYLWAIYVKQQYIVGAQEIVIASVLVVLSLELRKKYPKLMAREMRGYQDNVLGPVSLIGAISAAFIAVCFYIDSITHIANAPLAAFKDIIDTIK